MREFLSRVIAGDQTAITLFVFCILVLIAAALVIRWIASKPAFQFLGKAGIVVLLIGAIAAPSETFNVFAAVIDWVWHTSIDRFQ